MPGFSPVTIAGVVGTTTRPFSFDASVITLVELNMPMTGGVNLTLNGTSTKSCLALLFAGL
jgi:hypothetical protein